VTVIVNQVDVIAEQPSPDRVRDTPPEQRPQPGPTPQDILRALRQEALRRQRLLAS
jgi:hypothetical protein